MSFISVNQLSQELSQPKKIILIDVRSAEEFQSGKIDQAINIPVQEINSHTEKLKEYSKVYLICQSGNRSQLAAMLLSAQGLNNAVNVKGGMLAWRAGGFPVV